MSARFDLECSVCLDPYKDPRLLNCGHTFCKKCLLGILRGSTSKNIACPECKAVTNTSQGLDALMINWAVKKALNNETPVSSATSSAPVPVTPPCRNHKVQASMYCGNCRIYICTECIPSHSDHLSRLGPIDTGKSGYGKQINSMRSRVSKRIRDFDDKIEEWSDLENEMENAREPQDDLVKALKQVLDLLQGKLDDFQTNLNDSCEPIETLISSTLQSLRADRATFISLSERLRNAPVRLDTGVVPDWSVVSESDSALARLHVPSEVPSIRTREIFGMKYGPIQKVEERIQELQVVTMQLPVPMFGSDELNATFEDVGSINEHTSKSFKFGQFNLSIQIEFAKAGGKRDRTIYLGIFLQAEWEEDDPNEELLVDLTICLRNQRQVSGGKKENCSARIRNGDGRGFACFLPKSVALDPSHGYCLDDTLKVRVDFTARGLYYPDRRDAMCE